MKHIVEAFSTIIFMLLVTFCGISVITLCSEIVAAKEFKMDIVNEIENSNFNPAVIQECIAQAADEGYALTVTPAAYDAFHNVNMAEIVLAYPYELPLMGIHETGETRAMAR